MKKHCVTDLLATLASQLQHKTKELDKWKMFMFITKSFIFFPLKCKAALLSGAAHVPAVNVLHIRQDLILKPRVQNYGCSFLFIYIVFVTDCTQSMSDAPV